MCCLQTEEEGESGQPASSGGSSGTSSGTLGRSMPPPPGDMMSEMARKLRDRKAKTETGVGFTGCYFQNDMNFF